MISNFRLYRKRATSAKMDTRKTTDGPLYIGYFLSKDDI